MNINVAGLINLLGYTIGVALYGLLLGIVVRHLGQGPVRDRLRDFRLPANWLMLATAVLGLVWNLGALATYGRRSFGLGFSNAFPVLSAISFSALGFLPAVVVQSVILNRLGQPIRLISRIISISAYCLSAAASLLFFYAAVVTGTSPSLWALRLLTLGYLVLVAVLMISTRGQEGWKKAVWASALAVFAVSALHLSHHQGGTEDAWYTELIGHHASLLLAFAILYEDYRFAFADIFLKRALALLALMTIAVSSYFGLASIVFPRHSLDDARVFAALLGLWVLTALTYPALRRGVVWFVDAVVLKRADYDSLRAEIAQRITRFESEREIIEEVSQLLVPAVSARQITWEEMRPASDEKPSQPDAENQQPVDIPLHGHVTLPVAAGSSASVFVPTAEPPYYRFEITSLAGGRRLLSDDIEMLESVALMVARRIDALRVTHERCEQNLREQEINKLATEAQLRALRAQVNPHFLFNALTTIGHLIQTAPDRALETLMKLTSLLRGVLRTEGEFVTLEEEFKLIASYLDIEKARFEERLRVSIDVPEELLSKRLPSLLVQPLVENSIKHGIAPSRSGGELSVCARLEQTSADQSPNGEVLSISVIDTGIGVSEIELARGRKRGFGISNIEERLRFYGGKSASLRIRSTPGTGTMVELRVPVIMTELMSQTAGSLTNRREKKA